MKSIEGAALALFMLCLLTGLGASSTTVINFENLKPIGPQGGVLFDQYSNLGIIFPSKPMIIDFAQKGLPQFPHSGSVAIECNSNSGILMTFPQPVSRVKVWVGYDPSAGGIGCNNPNTYVVIAENNITYTKIPLSCGAGSSTDFSRIQVPMEIKSNAYDIGSVQIYLSNTPSGTDTGISKGLAIDDVEFDVDSSTDLINHYHSAGVNTGPYINAQRPISNNNYGTVDNHIVKGGKSQA